MYHFPFFHMIWHSPQIITTGFAGLLERSYISCFCAYQDVEQSPGLHQAALNLGHELLRPPHSLLLSLEDNFHRALWMYFWFLRII